MEAVCVNRLSKEYINELPIIRFEGEVVMVTTVEEADEAVKCLMQEECVGFDTESRPSFNKWTAYPISLLQFATKEKAYLFQVKKTGFTEGLKEFLEDIRVKKVGVGIKADIAKLQNLITFNPLGFVDLSQLAAEKGIIQVGVRGLTARYLHRRLAKTAQKTNWARSDLSEKQQLYAATDAWICLCVYPYLLADTLDYRQFREQPESSNPSGYSTRSKGI